MGENQTMKYSYIDRVRGLLSRVRYSPIARGIVSKYHQLPRRYKKVVEVVGFASLAIILIQLVYPGSKMLPNTQIGGKSYSFAAKSSTASSLVKTGKDAKVTVRVGKDTVSTSMTDMGISIDAQKTTAPVINYPWYWRLIPLTIFAPHHSPDFAVKSDNSEKTKAFVAGLEKYGVAPINASIAITGTDVIVVNGNTGLSYSGGNQQSFLTKARLTPAFSINLSAQTTQPKVGNKAAQKTADIIKKQIGTQFTVAVENQVETVKPETLAGWITTTPDEAKGTLAIGYTKDKIKEYLQPYADKVYVAGVAKKVTTVDGVVTSEVGGSPGRAMKLDSSVEEVVKSLTASQSTAKTIVQAVTPTQVVSASYTRTSKGLQALLEAWTKAHKGSYNIALRTTTGDISASLNSSSKIYPASIYKLFVADVAYNKAASGQLDLNAEVMSGKSASACIELMIVRSDNPCAYAVGDAIGWEANNGFLASQGLGSTTLKQHSWNTNANDILNLLLKLQNGSLVNSEYRATLLDMMSRQIYRSGIPAGSAGGVADKVGFIDNYNHDAGIVYHPNGTYALVIMTTNSSFSNVADLARQISNVMKQ